VKDRIINVFERIGATDLNGTANLVLPPAPVRYTRLTAMPLAAGDRLGPYEILAFIGKGGMGEVYCARVGIRNRPGSRAIRR
jgi:hypothetical protein